MTGFANAVTSPIIRTNTCRVIVRFILLPPNSNPPKINVILSANKVHTAQERVPGGPEGVMSAYRTMHIGTRIGSIRIFREHRLPGLIQITRIAAQLGTILTMYGAHCVSTVGR
jgi:hypothetical protein